VRLDALVGPTGPAVLPILAYVVGQLLVVTGWTRRPVGTPRVPRARTPVDVLSRR